VEIRKAADGRAALAAWLRSDWSSPAARQEIEFRLQVWNATTDLIERPRLDRLWDHWVRLKILEGFREPAWERLPEDLRWVEAATAAPEAGEWRARPGDAAWDLLSGGTGRIADVAACAKAGELPGGCPMREAHRAQAALDLIRRIARGMERRPVEDPILLLAPAEAGPFTILDGHKRAAAAYLAAVLDGKGNAVGPLSAYLGVSPAPSPLRRG
jgi:hypothetical protein